MNYKILVIGDIMLDVYLKGISKRISAEAPVLIIENMEMEEFLGGAGNVAANLASLKCDHSIVCVHGDDSCGDKISDLCKKLRVNKKSFVDPSAITTTKTRVVVGTHQIVRLDNEKIWKGTDDKIDQLFGLIKEDIDDISAIIFADYAKGVLIDNQIIKKTIAICENYGISVFVDPIRYDWERYIGAFCITPNLSELEEFSNTSIGDNKEKMVMIAEDILHRFKIKYMVVTLGGRGCCLVQEGTDAIFIDSVAKQVFDVCGAGDTLIATLCHYYVLGLDLGTALRNANIAAGIVVGKTGTQPINIDELEEAIGHYDRRNIKRN